MLEKIDTVESLLFDCQCAIFLIDSTEKKSINELEKLLVQLNLSDFSYLQTILVENKIGETIEISEDKIKEVMKKNGIKEHKKILLKDGEGVEELSNKIKQYINKPEKHIPINFTLQLKDEFLNEGNDNLFPKGMKAVNLILVGNSSVGKTSLFLRINKNYFKESFLSTIGFDRCFKTFKYKEELLKVCITDTAGQDRYRTLPSKFYVNADGIFLLFDLTNRESFNEVAVWMTEVKKHIGNPDENKKGPIIYLVGNKLDFINRVISREEAEDKANLFGIKYFEISCKLNINIQEIYSRMVLECSHNIKIKSSQGSFQIKIEKKQKKRKKTCCDI